MLHDCRWTSPAVYNLGATEKLVFQWLLGNKDSSLTGVYTVMTGAIMDGIGYHNFDNKAMGSPVYPFLDILVENGAIAYDKSSHTVRIIDYHRFRPFGNGNPLIVVNSLEKNILSLHNKDFFVDYVFENYDIIAKKVEEGKEAYKKALIKATKEGKTVKLTAPDNLINLQECISLATKMKKPDNEITPKITRSLVENTKDNRLLSNS